ncbi:MAG: phosphatase PAP2 family protein [Methyloceanibacter sp.]
MTPRLKHVTLLEQAVLALSLLLFCLLLVDPFMRERAVALPPEPTAFFRAITDLGRSNWMLILSGAPLALALILRRRHQYPKHAAAYGLIASTAGFVFASIAATVIVTNLAKGIVGRARPMLFDAGGALEFKLFAFSPEYASLPSGHAANSFALATALGMLWPRARVLLYTLAVWIAASRVLIGEHYFSDAVLGALLGIAIPHLVRDRFAARGWLFERRQAGYRLRGARVRRWLGWPAVGEVRRTGAA